MPDATRVPPQADRLADEVTRLVTSNPADRSVLRHSLGQAPKEVAMGVHRIVVPFLPDRSPYPADQAHHEAAEKAYYMVAALIAAQDRKARDQAGTGEIPESEPAAPPGQETAARTRPPAGRNTRNLGYSLAQAAHKSDKDKSKTLGDRLELLARQDIDGMYRHLPRLILQLRADQVHIDWGLLIHDLTQWDRDPRQVAKEWAQAFYRTSERLIAEKKRKAEQAASGTDNQETGT